MSTELLLQKEHCFESWILRWQWLWLALCLWMSGVSFLASLSLSVKWLDFTRWSKILSYSESICFTCNSSMYFRYLYIYIYIYICLYIYISYMSYIYNSETMCISLEKKSRFLVDKKMHNIYFFNISTPKLCYWKLIRFLVFCFRDLKIIHDFMFFRLILVNATESII